MAILPYIPTILSIVSTIIIGLVGWGFRTTITGLRGEIKTNTDNIDKVTLLIEKIDSLQSERMDKMDSRQSERMDKLETSFNDLKSDLPLVYVLREDFVRTMNNVESRMMGMDNKLDRLLEKTAIGGKKDG